MITSAYRMVIKVGYSGFREGVGLPPGFLPDRPFCYNLNIIMELGLVLPIFPISQF